MADFSNRLIFNKLRFSGISKIVFHTFWLHNLAAEEGCIRNILAEARGLVSLSPAVEGWFGVSQTG
jgi:hypothetical protein